MNDLNDLPEPTWRLLLGRGLPLFGVEGLLPVAVFYLLWRTAGLGAGIAVATVLSLAIVAWQSRRGKFGALAGASVAFIVIQALVSLVTHSGTVYLARPIIQSAAWGIAYAGSVVIGRPLIGVLADTWYPFPAWFQASAVYQREFGLQTLAWSIVCFARAAAGLALLTSAGTGVFLAYAGVSGLPLSLALIAWGLWHARRTFTAAPVELAAAASM